MMQCQNPKLTPVEIANIMSNIFSVLHWELEIARHEIDVMRQEINDIKEKLK